MKYCNTLSLRLASVSALMLLMVACGSSPKRGPSEFASKQQDLEQILRQADLAVPSNRHPLLIRAVSILLSNEKPDKAIELLQHIDDRYLSSLQKDTFHLFYGEVLLSKELTKFQDSKQASLSQLLKVNHPSSHSIEWQIRYFQSLSDSYLANGNYLESAKQRIDINDLIDDASELAQNNNQIWLAIDHMSPLFLEQTITDFNSKRLNGWLEIVRINKVWGNQPDELLSQMEQWKSRYPLHPAAVVKPNSLKSIAITDEIKAQNIAVLLPLSGRFKRSGKMIHDGIIAAQFQQQQLNDIPNIRFYDTAQSLSSVTSYQQALSDGADFVIGPLRKKAINDIVALDSLDTPFLFLNTTADMPERHQLAFQFVLSIEDEAIQAAHRAWENGYRKAIAFIPSDRRGKRALAAFKNYFEQLGGELIDSEEYKDIKTISKNVQNLLRVNSSIARKTQLQNILGRNLEFEMRRRQDADFIFLVSKPTEARRIKPFINFYFALDLPVIATSDIHSGLNSLLDDKVNTDLNDIEFSDIPLYISQQPSMVEARNTLQNIDGNILKGSNGRLFALGYDAFQIISQITRLRAFPNYRWYGLSGEIGIDELSLVHRYLTWAKFKNGQPKATKERLPPAPLATTQL